MTKPSLLPSPFGGGFECSSHRRRDGVRLDVVAATAHDRLALGDYRRLRAHGMDWARDGLRWHLIEAVPGHYDWSSFRPMLHAAREAGIQVIWDVMHYGWPDWTDPWQPDFAARFTAFAGAAARVAGEVTPGAFYVPVNEISFLAWGGGEVGYLNPFGRRQGDRLKHILCDAFIRAAAAIRSADAGARIACAEPLVAVHPRRPGDPASIFAAEQEHEAQFVALDTLLGRRSPALGGEEGTIDLIGLNHYPLNQWTCGAGRKIMRGNPRHIPFARLLGEVARRYHRQPLFVAETGCEGKARSAWLAAVTDEVHTARAVDVPVEGICLYPVLSHLGWDNERYCPNGLFCGVAADGARTVYRPLADELARQQQRRALTRPLQPVAC